MTGGLSIDLDNMADTVLELFVDGVSKFGLPSRVKR